MCEPGTEIFRRKVCKHRAPECGLDGRRLFSEFEVDPLRLRAVDDGDVADVVSIQDTRIAGGSRKPAEDVCHGDAGRFGEQQPAPVADPHEPRVWADLVAAIVR